MIWLELALTATLGAAAGWIARSLIRRRPESVRGPGPESRSAHVVEAVSSFPAAAGAIPARAGQESRPRISKDADTAGKVIVHLASLGRLGADDIALLGHTQRGMTEALGLRQGTLAKVLSRLESAEVVEVDRRHVRGQPHRLKVYRLTALGESVARDIRHRNDPGANGPQFRSS